MCLLIEKGKEMQAFADYFFIATVWDKDPRFRSRSMIVGETRGLLRLDKQTGAMELLYPMPEDKDERRFRSACAVLRRHWQDGELPEKTMFACG
jgi:hypothetical protein